MFNFKIKGFKDFFTKVFQGKIQTKNDLGGGGTIVQLDEFTQALFTRHDFRSLAKIGYIENHIANTCIRRTAAAMASIKFDVLIDDVSIHDDSRKGDRLSKAFRELIINPNVDYNWCRLLEGTISNKCIGGSGYIYPDVGVMKEPLSIEFFRPDRIAKLNSGDERVHQYQYTRGTRRQLFTRDEDGYFDLIEWQSYNPLSDINGLSGIIPAGLVIDGHNEANIWNKKLLSNGAKFSGMISPAEESTLSPEQANALQKKIKEMIYTNNGGIMINNAPTKFEPLNLTAVEMDWLNGIKHNAIAIASAFDYPPVLLNLDGTTYNNQKEAKMDLYENSAIPKCEEFYGLLSSFYSRVIGRKIVFKIDLKSIVALAPRMKEISEQARGEFKDGLISQNEGRENIGLEPVDDGDIFVDQNKAPIMGNNPET